MVFIMRSHTLAPHGTSDTPGERGLYRHLSSLVGRALLYVISALTLVSLVPATSFALSSDTSSQTINVATWNMKFDNKQSVTTGVKQILASADVVGLQEVHKTAQRNRIKKLICSSCEYAGYLPSYHKDKTGPASTPIVWNRSKFSLVGKGHYQKVTTSTKLHGKNIRAKYITWVRLHDKLTGREFYVVNTHFVRSVEYAGAPGGNTRLNTRYQQHMAKLVALLTKLQASDIPIFVTGDFAVGYREDAAVQTSYFPYASLRPLGVYSNWELTAADNYIPIPGTYSYHSNINNTDVSRLIDYVMIWQRDDTQPLMTDVANDTYGSDHHPVFLSVTLTTPATDPYPLDPPSN